MNRSRHRRSALALSALFALGATMVACGGGSKPAAARPTTTARIQIVSPTPNQTTAPDVELELRLIGARVVQETKGPLSSDEGHIHVSVDGKLVSMAYGTTQDLKALAPGPHSVQAEFVAKDHAPFRNRVVAGVLFTVAS